MKKPQIPIAREGYPFIFFSSFMTLVFAQADLLWLTLLCLILTAFIMYFFRDPERFIPPKSHVVVSPADGRILYVKKEENSEFSENEVIKISIFMNIFNVHVNRVAIAGTVKKIIYQPGKFYAADTEKAELHNENCTSVIETSNGTTIVVVQIAGLIARRIINWLEVGDIIDKGTRMGLIRFGSRVDLYLPANTVIAVEKGQKVRAGESIIGYLDK